MNPKTGYRLSRPLLLSLAALMIWAAAGASVLQFFAGGLLWGVLFATTAVVFLGLALEGSLLRRAEGRPASRTNLLLLVGVLVLVSGNELWGLFISSANSGPQFVAQLVFSLGLILLTGITARNALVATGPN